MNTAFSHQSHALLALGLHLIFSAPARAATPREQARAAFMRFVACQNAHDSAGVAPLLWESPDFVWVTRDRQVRDAAAAMALFRKNFTVTWRMEPVMARFSAVELAPGRVQVLVPMVFSRGAAGRPPRQKRCLCSVALRREDDGWRIAAMVPTAVTASIACARQKTNIQT